MNRAKSPAHMIVIIIITKMYDQLSPEVHKLLLICMYAGGQFV
jgi:hypothetical protein